MVGGKCVQDGTTALIAAAEGGHTSAVEALVAAGANVNTSDNGVSQHSVALLKVRAYSIVVRITLYLFSLYHGGWWMCAVWCNRINCSSKRWTHLGSGGVGGSWREREPCCGRMIFLFQTTLDIYIYLIYIYIYKCCLLACAIS